MLLFVAVNLVLTLVALELALRVQEPFFQLMSWQHSNSPNYRFVVVDHPVWNHQLRPNLDGFWLRVRDHHGEDILYPLHTNAWGCRYPEIAVPRPSGRFRVIVMGDSFTEGYREEDSVSRLLEDSLDAGGAPLDYEVVNCGMSSYSVITILLRLREQLLAAEPDAVIVNLDLTDMHDDYWRRRPELVTDAAGTPLSAGSEDGSGKLRSSLERHSYVVRAFTAYSRLVEKLVRGWLRGEAEGDAEGDAGAVLTTLNDRYRMHTFQPEAADEFEQAWSFFSEQLDRLIDLCEDAGIPCAFSSYPHKAQLPSGDEPPQVRLEFQRRLAAHLAARDVVFFDAYEPIARAYARDPEIYLPDDMHYGPEGQRIWGRAFAQAFTPWVREQARRAAGRTPQPDQG